MDKYKNKLLNVASKFDAVTDANGEVIQIVNLIVESDVKNATIKLLKIYRIILLIRKKIK